MKLIFAITRRKKMSDARSGVGASRADEDARQNAGETSAQLHPATDRVIRPVPASPLVQRASSRHLVSLPPTTPAAVRQTGWKDTVTGFVDRPARIETQYVQNG